jgi:hypothetical protein
MPPVFSTLHQARKIAEFLAKPEVKEMSAGLEEIAQAVAVAVEDKALTERIYEKCMEKFDGETNTLWMHLEADSKLKSQGGWNKRVDAELSKGRKNATVKGIGNVDAAVKKFEKTLNAPLHLFWMYPSGWDKKTTPLVAFVQFDINPKNRTSVPAFDAQGNRFEIGKDAELAKKRPVIVINVNERTNINGKVKKELFASSHESVVNTSRSPILLQPVDPATLFFKKGKEGATQVQSVRNVSITLMALYINPIWAMDEWPIDGASEFYSYTVQQIEKPDPTFGSMLYYKELNYTYWGNLTTGVNVNLVRDIGTGKLGLYSSSEFGHPVFGTSWFEADFIFSDEMGTHGPLYASTGVGVVNTPGSNTNVSATYRLTTY